MIFVLRKLRIFNKFPTAARQQLSFLKKVPFAPQAVYFFAFNIYILIFNINFDIYFYQITKMIYIL